MSSNPRGSEQAPRVESHRHAPPHKSIQEVLTKAPYPLPNAIAELVDNSLDAGATRICVRFRRSALRATGIQVIDNGRGISEPVFDDIMRFAWKSKHHTSDIGMYGVGLKTAALSQAEVLRVYSKTRGASPHGRQWLKADLGSERLGVLHNSDVAERYLEVSRTSANVPINVCGTIVELERVTDLERSVNDPEKYLKNATQDIDSHLGLTFHRFLERTGSANIRMFIEIEQDGEITGSRVIVPVNPFKYDRPGARGWPKKFRIQVPTPNTPGKFVKLDAIAHIWPKGNKLPGYKIRRVGGRTNAVDSQGLFFYLNDRIVMAGGWANVRTSEAHFSLARMEIELTPEAQSIIEIGYSKDTVKTPASFIDAIRNSNASDGTTFANWVDLAQEVFRTRDDTEPRLPELPIPGSWMRQSAMKTIAQSDFPKGETVNVVWGRLGANTVFKIDHHKQRIILNNSLRPNMDRILGSPARYEMFQFLLLMTCREHFGDRKTARLKRFEKLLNDTLMAIFK